MEQTIKLEMTKDEAEKLSVVIEQCLEALDESNERGKQTQYEIDQLQAETRAILNQLRKVFNVEATFRSIF